MSVDRLTRLNELLRREISEALFRLVDPDSMDMAAITVTGVQIHADLREARVSVSIRGHEGERERMLSKLRQRRVEIQRIINRDIVLKYTPRLSFELDPSLEKGAHVLDLLSELEKERGGPDAAGASPPAGEAPAEEVDEQ